MAEQLELFGDDAFPQEEREKIEAPLPKPEKPPEPEETKEGMVTLSIGYDEALSLRARDLLNGFGLPEAAEAVYVNWNKRMRSTAGRAHYKKSRIELNPQLQVLPEPKRTEEIEGTFLHELAHLLAFERNRNRRIQPHGIEWKQACADLGIPGEDRCHDLDFGTSRRMKKKFAYECPSCKCVLPRVRRIKRPVACHPCCKRHNRGRFDARFQLIEKRLN